MSGSSVLLDEIVRMVEQDGRASLDRWSGPFLLEIRIEDPSRLVVQQAVQDRHTPSSRTTESYPVDDLLDLRRMRGVTDVRVYPLRDKAVAGRGKDCLVKLGDPAAALSKHHAKFTLEGDAWQLTDLGSRNGTFVDRTSVEPNASVPVESFSRIQLGDKRFVFLAREDLYALAAPIRSADAISLESLAAELESLGSRRFLLRHDSFHLLVDIGSKGSFRPQTAYPLTGKSALTLGRSREADVHVPGRAVSKQHSRLFQKDGESWYLEDSGSSYGTEKNGVKLKKDEASRLLAWDSCSFGSSRVRGLFVDSRGLLEFLAEEHKR